MAMRKYALALIFLGTGMLAACDMGALDTQPLDQPSDQTFFSTEAELVRAVNAAYNKLSPETFWGGTLSFSLQGMSDNGWLRGGWGGAKAVASGAHDPQTDIVGSVWEEYYEGISRTNNLLENMHRAEGNVSSDLYERIRGEAKFLRAYYYHRLSTIYGDVPLITKVQNLDSTRVGRTPKAEVVGFILSELEDAAAMLPETYPDEDEGRATRGTALAVKARAALYNEQWDVAIDAAQRVMDMGVYSLHPDYGELFTYSGQSSDEIILSYRYLEGTRTHMLPQHGLTRMTGGWSVPVPLQPLVDAYYCTDGKRIDNSPLYDPAHPFENRDPRLDATIVRPGARFGNYRFLSHPDSVQTWNYATGEWVENTDVTNPYATFTGYTWRKYMTEEDFDQTNESELNWILVRYAEVLLTYAEAKIEAGQIDDSVYEAINQVRARVDMPPVGRSGSEQDLRRLVRHERRVELAMEGQRFFDIKRWEIAEEALSGPVVGRPQEGYRTMGIPTFSEHGIPNYSAYLDEMRVIEERQFDPSRGYLWPIPQSEMDVNPQLQQNPGY